MPRNEPICDWLNLTANVAPQSLWESLHDGKLLAVQSSLRERTVLLEFDVPHLRQHHELDNAVRFLIRLEEVQSARVRTWARWPGGFADDPHETSEERSRRIEEYQAKWREESFDWNTFVDALATDPLLITDAQSARGSDAAALQIDGNLDGDKFDDQFFSVCLRAKRFTIKQSNGILLSLESFIQLGDAFWDAFSARSEIRH